MTTKNNTPWNPEYYSKHSATQLGHARDLLETYPFKGNEFILDIGCGDGKITAAIASLVPEGRVVGLDIDTKNIAFAQEKFPVNNYSNLQFTHADITKMDKLGEFDLIVSFSCLHYVKDQLSALKNIKNNLKADGKLILMLYRKCKAQWSALDAACNDSRWQHYFNGYDPGYYEYLPDSYQGLLNQAGLAQFYSQFTSEEIVSYENIVVFSNFIKGWLPHLNILPDQYHTEFLDLFLREYFKNLGINARDGINIPFVRLIIN